jgi:hypothetical protein
MLIFVQFNLNDRLEQDFELVAINATHDASGVYISLAFHCSNLNQPCMFRTNRGSCPGDGKKWNGKTSQPLLWW